MERRIIRKWEDYICEVERKVYKMRGEFSFVPIKRSFIELRDVAWADNST